MTQEKIKQLKEDIKIEEMQYEISCEHPTDTAMYRRALQKQGEKIGNMKRELEKLLK